MHSDTRLGVQNHDCRRDFHGCDSQVSSHLRSLTARKWPRFGEVVVMDDDGDEIAEQETQVDKHLNIVKTWPHKRIAMEMAKRQRQVDSLWHKVRMLQQRKRRARRTIKSSKREVGQEKGKADRSWDHGFSYSPQPCSHCCCCLSRPNSVGGYLSADCQQMRGGLWLCLGGSMCPSVRLV